MMTMIKLQKRGFDPRRIVPGFLWFVFLLTALQSEAQEINHLIPVSGPFSDLEVVNRYKVDIRSVLLQNPNTATLARMVILPSSEPEAVVSIVFKDNKYYVEHSQASEMIWSYDYPHKIKLVTSSRPLDEEVAQLMEKVFDQALLTTRYPQELPPVADGARYYFSAKGREGYTCSPAAQTVPGQLVGLGRLLIDYAKKNSSGQKLRKQIKAHGQALLAELDTIPASQPE